MRKILIRRYYLLVALLLPLFAYGQNDYKPSGDAASEGPGAHPRQIINFDPGWKFLIGDHPGAQAVGYDDSQWQWITLPHSFSTPYWGEPTFYAGYGWYRKQFTVPVSWAGKRIFLEFDGAFQDAVVYVNGIQIGEHKGGFTGFSMDITNAAHSGDNLVAVQLNNIWNPEICPISGDHEFSGGIYRDVSLVVTDPLHVTWYGTFVTTPQISSTAANVNIKTEVANSDSNDAVCTVVNTILDPDGSSVASIRSSQVVPANSIVVFDQTTHPIPHPLLWDPDHPNLYKVETSIYKAPVRREDNSGGGPFGRVVDNYESPLGFRWIEWTAEQGFFLNGKHLFFFGTNVHQDHAGWCDAVADSGIYRDVQLVKDAGFNFIRGSHYSHSPKFTAATDALGIMFWSENCFWGSPGGSGGAWGQSNGYPTNLPNPDAYDQNVLDTLRDMIRIHRNHPSVIIWSMCNEVFFNADTTRTKALLQAEVNLCHQLDPTRKAAIGGSQRGLGQTYPGTPAYAQTRIDNLGDVAGYNGDGASIPALQDPGFPNVVSEYEQTSLGFRRPGPNDGEWGSVQLDSNGNPIEYPWRSGISFWCAFDYGTVYATPGQGASSYGADGLIDYFRLPKNAWYWYRNYLDKVPEPPARVAGTASKLQLTSTASRVASDGTEDCQLVVSVTAADGTPLSNSPSVTLSINGPSQFPTGSTITFDANNPDIPIRNGLAAIEMHVTGRGTITVQASSAGLQGAIVKITAN
jgi:glycosyl hydrolase family 2